MATCTKFSACHNIFITHENTWQRISCIKGTRSGGVWLLQAPSTQAPSTRKARGRKTQPSPDSGLERRSS